MKLRETLAKNVREARLARDWTQEDLAEASGLHRTYISQLETASRNPTIDVLERLSAALRVSIEALVRKPH
jgi:transcriptional regulator with XRE-family HTH domain